MGYKNIFRELMREYDRARTQAQLLLERRREEVYQTVPRIKEIDEEIAATGFQMAKCILGGGESHDLIVRLRENNRMLSAERAALMAANGIPADFFTSIYSCGLCKDTGYIQSDDNIGTEEKCSCLKQRLIDKHYKLSNIGDVMSVENFDTFDLRYYSEQVNPELGTSPRAAIQFIYRACMDFMANFDKGFNNMLFYGEPGLGKTFLCNCIAKDILDMGRTVLYVTAPQLFKIIENYRFNRDEMDDPNEYIDYVTEVDLLIIDDLGTEFGTLVTASELFNIINSRILAKKHTIISTNLAPSDFHNHYSERLTSRLFGNYRMLKFIGEDIRPKKKYRA